MRKTPGYGASSLMILVLLLASASLVSAQQSFSCPYGTQGACLDYGDQVCSRLAKCVDESAKCFQAYTCNYQGFVCKSDYEEAVDEYNTLLIRYNSLTNDYNNLLMRHDNNVDEYNELLDRYTELSNCLSYADDLEEAKRCSW